MRAWACFHVKIKSEGQAEAESNSVQTGFQKHDAELLWRFWDAAPELEELRVGRMLALAKGPPARPRAPSVALVQMRGLRPKQQHLWR